MAKPKPAPVIVPDGKAPCRMCKGPVGFRSRYAIIAIPRVEGLPAEDIFHPTCVGSWLTSNEGMGHALRFMPGEAP